MPKTERKIPAAGYVRMSTDQQDNSPERQRREIGLLAERYGYTVAAWYEDHGETGTTSENRPEFLRMLTDAKAGKFRAVLVHENSRFSREDVFDAMQHWHLLQKAGVKLVSSTRGEMKFDDLAGMIVALVDQHGARSESIKIAQRTLSGKLAKASKGIRFGAAPFGYDREIVDNRGVVVRRVAAHERFQIAGTDMQSRLVPAANLEHVDAVRMAFERTAAGEAMFRIVRDWNKLGLRTPRQGTLWDQTSIKRLLRNPVYAGTFRYGHQPQGVFARAEDQTILRPNSHPPLVSQELFDQVQAALDMRVFNRTRTPEGRWLLSGKIVCGNCGKRIYGFSYTNWQGERRHDYRCTFRAHGMNECTARPYINAARLENIVLEMFAEYVLTPENVRHSIRAAVTLAAREEPDIEGQNATELQRRIDRAMENLALCDEENRPGIEKLLARWRGELRQLNDRIARRLQFARPSDEEIEVLENLSRIREKLHLAERKTLAEVLNPLIKRIVLGRRNVEGERGQPMSQLYGTVEFMPHAYDGPPIEFGMAALYTEAGFQRVANYVRRAKRAVKLGELTDFMQLGPNTVVYHANRAVAFGLLEKVPERGGWVAVPDSQSDAT